MSKPRVLELSSGISSIAEPILLLAWLGHQSYLWLLCTSLVADIGYEVQKTELWTQPYITQPEAQYSTQYQ
jgi:hypothetical protein